MSVFVAGVDEIERAAIVKVAPAVYVIEIVPSHAAEIVTVT